MRWIRMAAGVGVMMACGATPLMAADPLRPFPQHTIYAAGSIKPNHVSQSQLDAAVRTFYDSWKAVYIVPACGADQYHVKYDEEEGAGGSSSGTIAISEGHGYGMLITVLMAGYDPAAKVIFDGLFQYYRAHPSVVNPKLMAWNQVTGCVDGPDGGDESATDGDLDIAFALLLADQQWGSGGGINYGQAALDIIAAIKKDEINQNVGSVKLGDWLTPDDSRYFNSTRPSDFMGDHFRAFQRATGDESWQRVVDTCYSVVAIVQKKYSPKTGLLPDFVCAVNKAPVPAKKNFLETQHDGQYSYNSCRVPFRLGVDYLVSGDPRAGAAVNKINVWIKTKTKGNPDAIRAGYHLNGSPIDKDTAMAFHAPLGVGAMVSSGNQAWLNALWSYIVASDSEWDLYYGRTLKMLCLIVMSGNYWSPVPL